MAADLESRREAVRAEIEAGFAATPPPDPRQLIATYDDEGIVDYFAGRDRWDHTPWDLRWLEASLSYFTPSAFRYYVPAYMLATLDDRDTMDSVPDRLWRTFCDWSGSSDLFRMTLAELFTEPERAAIAAFIRYESDVRVETEVVRQPESLRWSEILELERETRAILRNLGCLQSPENLLCSEIRRDLFARRGVEFGEEPPLG
ncbi:MAG: hypothetical protein AMXMBFR47_33980 [Planctomycetota bacterium]